MPSDLTFPETDLSAVRALPSLTDMSTIQTACDLTFETMKEAGVDAPKVSRWLGLMFVRMVSPSQTYRPWEIPDPPPLEDLTEDELRTLLSLLDANLAKWGDLRGRDSLSLSEHRAAVAERIPA